MGYTLYGATVSPFVRKALTFMVEKEIPFESVPVNPVDPPENYRQTSPLGKIPALIHDDKAIADSSVICAYLERRHPTPPLYPSDDYAYSRALWFEEFIDGAFVAKAGGEIFFPLVVAPLMMKQPVTDETRAAADKCLQENIKPMWDYLEGELSTHEFFVGETLTIADLAVASIHVNLFHAGIDVDEARCPNLAAYIQRMHERPSFATIIAEETPMWSRRD